VSTYTRITVTHLGGDPLDPDAVFKVVEAHLDLDYYDGDGPDYAYDGATYAYDGATFAVSADQHGKYSATLGANVGDLSSELTRLFGNVSLQIEEDEDWDDDGPGASCDVWIDGKRVKAASSTMMHVNEELAELLDVGTDGVHRG
jgi:hypothetical protein